MLILFVMKSFLKKKKKTLLIDLKPLNEIRLEYMDEFENTERVKSDIMPFENGLTG